MTFDSIANFFFPSQGITPKRSEGFLTKTGQNKGSLLFFWGGSSLRRPVTSALPPRFFVTPT